MKSEQPMKIGFVGTVVAVIGGGAIYHWLNSGSLPNAMMTAPTATSAGYGALIGGLSALSLPNIPFVGPMISKLLGSLAGILGVGKKIRDAIPPALITDIMAILKKSGGKLSLADLEKLIADFEQIDPAVIMQLIRDAISAIRGGGDVPVPTPTPTPGPAVKGVAPVAATTSDIEVSV